MLQHDGKERSARSADPSFMSVCAETLSLSSEELLTLRQNFDCVFIDPPLYRFGLEYFLVHP